MAPPVKRLAAAVPAARQVPDLTRRTGTVNDITYEGQLAARAAELLPGIGTDERLKLLAAMNQDDMSASLAWLATAYPQVFDFALVRDRKLTVELLARLDEADTDQDDPEPYCSACGASIGIFLNHGQDWHHYRGEGTVASPVELYDAGHEPAVAWRENGRHACCRHCTHGDMIPPDRHTNRCPDGCNDSDEVAR